MKSLAFRLKPGDYLKKGINNFVIKNTIKAGWMATCAGSLTQYNIRFANQLGRIKNNGHLEIVSLTGTLLINGSQVHIIVSDSIGKTIGKAIGGYVINECLVYTTVEILVQQSDEFEFFKTKRWYHPLGRTPD